MADSSRTGGAFGKIYALLRPVAKRVIFRSVSPGPATRWLYSGLFHADYFTRELYEWARRSLVATPVFLSQCARHGTDITVEQLPYVSGPCRIELGSRIRFAGKLNIIAGKDVPTLTLGDGVFVGHMTTFAVARRISVGDFVGIGERCYIADTEGHSHYAPNRPIWEVPPSADDVAEVVIEDNVQISHDCKILKGVRIGARAVIGAGSVVRTSIPPDAVVMGNPARVVKRMTPGE